MSISMDTKAVAANDIPTRPPTPDEQQQLSDFEILVMASAWRSACQHLDIMVNNFKWTDEKLAQWRELITK